MKLELTGCYKKLAYYENSDAPSFIGLMYSAEHTTYRKNMEDKDKTRRDIDNENIESEGDPANTFQGTPNASEGISHSNKAERPVTSRVTKCSKCGSESLGHLTPATKLVYDFADSKSIRIECIS